MLIMHKTIYAYCTSILYVRTYCTVICNKILYTVYSTYVRTYSLIAIDIYKILLIISIINLFIDKTLAAASFY